MKKLTTSKLKQIIKEELKLVLNELVPLEPRAAKTAETVPSVASRAKRQARISRAETGAQAAALENIKSEWPKKLQTMSDALRCWTKPSAAFPKAAAGENCDLTLAKVTARQLSWMAEKIGDPKYLESAQKAVAAVEAATVHFARLANTIDVTSDRTRPRWMGKPGNKYYDRGCKVLAKRYGSGNCEKQYQKFYEEVDEFQLTRLLGRKDKKFGRKHRRVMARLIKKKDKDPRSVRKVERELRRRMRTR